MDINYGYSPSVTPYNFSMPGSLAGITGYGTQGYDPLNTSGLGGVTATGGANTDVALPTTAGAGAGSLTGSLGMNIPTFQLGLQGLGSLANLYTGIKALGLAKDQFNFSKALATKNLNNSVTSYNTSLEDRANARAVTEGQSTADRDAYIAKNKLSA